MALSINPSLLNLFNAKNTQKSAQAVSSSMKKLSSGLKINSAKDNPAGLIISEMLRSQMSGLTQAISNTQNANNVLAIAEGGLSEVSNMLNQMRGLALHALNSGTTTREQVAANQNQLDSALNTISRISNSTTFSNKQLLNGSQDVRYNILNDSNIINASQTQFTQIPQSGNMNISYTGSTANQAEKAYITSNLGGTTSLQNAQSFTLTGNAGSKSFSFDAGTSISDMAAQINSSSESTGITAYAIYGDTELRLVSNDYGANQFVKIEQTQGNAFAQRGETAVDYGQNATLSVNGTAMQTNGLNLTVNNGNFNATVGFNEGSSTAATIAQTGYDQDNLTDAATNRTAVFNNFTGGMRFQLGESAGVQSRDTFAISGTDVNQLGRIQENGKTYSLQDLFSGGSASLMSDPAAALKVIDQAISDVATQRGRIGAYQANTLSTNANSLSVALENITATESQIRDTDMAYMITELTKNQLMEKAGLRSLVMGNMQAQNIAKLLGIG